MDDYKKAIEQISELFDKKLIKDLETAIEMTKNQYELLVSYFDTTDKEDEKQWCCRYIVSKTIPYVQKLLVNPKADNATTSSVYGIYRRSYAFAARRSLAHFIDFMEWDRPSDNKVFINRRKVLDPIVYYLNKLSFDDNMTVLGVSLPPGFGKTFVLNYYTAWEFGVNINNSFLRMSYDFDLLNGFSRSIKDLVASDNYAEVFPGFALYRNKPFDKEKDSDWKLKNADVLVSHYVRTRDGGTTGVRAKKAIIFDDMTKGADEASDDGLHEKYWKKYTTEWVNRRDGMKIKYIFAGTMWTPVDILNRIREKEASQSRLIPSKKFKYAMECEDGHAAFIAVPLLDENDRSTCEHVISTKEAHILRNITDPFLFSCVYQQDPIAPTGMEFAWEKIRQYSSLPTDELGDVQVTKYAFAALDPTRKGKDNISMPIFRSSLDGEDHYMVDVFYQKVAMTEAYDEIINKIEEHMITHLFVENNTDTSLKTVLEMKLKARGINYCIIDEKYNVAKKEVRIKDNRGLITRRMLFKRKGSMPPNSDYGRFMDAFTKYSFDYANKNDDAPDSLALYVAEIMLDGKKRNKVTALDRAKVGF